MGAPPAKLLHLAGPLTEEEQDAETPKAAGTRVFRLVEDV